MVCPAKNRALGFSTQTTTVAEPRAVANAVCPAHRPFAARHGTFFRYEAFENYLRDELGAEGLLLKAFMSHVRSLGNEEGFDLDDLKKSFVHDNIFSGVTRFGSDYATLDRIYEALDPSGTPGERSLSAKDLSGFAAILRNAYPRKHPFDLGREWKLLKTTGEWGLLLRMAGDDEAGNLTLSQGVHAALVGGQKSWEGKKRGVDAQHIWPGLVGLVMSNFTNLTPAHENAAASIRTAERR